MADAVATQTISDGAQFATFKFTNVSDGNGESAVKKIDVSALSVNPVTRQACSSVSIHNIWYSTIGMSVKIDFDASTNVLAWNLIADYSDNLDFSGFSGIPNNAGSGVTGDIDFTTVGHSSGDSYTIVMKVLKHYG
tara:strand:- start:2936 stop:3343 length:408 start_codon:yes stop_codon:yes gene_type:complete